MERGEKDSGREAGKRGREGGRKDCEGKREAGRRK